MFFNLLKYIINYYLILLIFQLNLIYSIPKLYGGGCSLIEDTIYYVGGKDQDKNEYNLDIYTWDLKNSPNLLKSGEAPWVKLEVDNAPKSLDGNVLGINKTKEIFLLGGKGDKLINSFRKFNIKDKKWTIDKKIGNVLQQLLKKGFQEDKLPKDIEPEEGLVNAYLISNDNNTDLYYFGGNVTDNKKQYRNKRIFTYDIEKDELVNKNREFKANDFGTAIYSSDQIIMFGGLSEGIPFSPDSYLYYSLNRNNTDTSSIYNQEMPYMRKLSSVKVGEYIYFMGGMEKDPEMLYRVSSGSIRRDNIKISGLLNTDSGCLVAYKNYLIYSLGLKNGKVSTLSQIINLNKNITVDYIDPKEGESSNKNNSKSSDSDDKNNSSNQAAIIGGSVGGTLVILGLLGGALYYYYKKKLQAEQEDILEPPELLKGMVWSEDSKVGQFETVVNFNSTQLTCFDDDITKPGNALVPMQNLSGSHTL